MKKIIYILLALLAIILIPVVAVYFELAKQHMPNPLLAESNEHIREELLKLTPLGVGMGDVLEYIHTKKEEW